MKIFLYEFITGGGLLGDGGPVPVSLRREGVAMLSALAADFAAVPGVTVVTTTDCRFDDAVLADCRVEVVADPAQEWELFTHLATAVDYTVVIAPEFDGHLLWRAEAVLAAGGRLLSPGPEVIRLAADKQRTAEHLAGAGVPVPRGVLVGPNDALPHDFAYPAVLKPVDGAGSQGVRLVESAASALEPSSGPRRLEQFCPGQPASVAALCGPGGHIVLPACRQRLASGADGADFAYLGGSLPLSPEEAERAAGLARRVLAALPPSVGYLGIDLVLGDDPAGQGDRVIEINPRLTTSYVGLRAACSGNLAAAMLVVAHGDRPPLSFRGDAIEFDADGTVRRACASR